MDIIIYDEEMDKHVHITLKRGPPVRHGASRRQDPGHLILAQEAIKTESGPRSSGPESATADTLAAGKTAGALRRHHRAATGGKGNWLPLEIIIARPFIEHLMMSAIMTVSGRDTGATLFGPADMQISANTSVKTIEGHYTCHTKSVITKPQNVLVMRDIMCSGYVAGCNTKFFGSKAAKAAPDKKGSRRA